MNQFVFVQALVGSQRYDTIHQDFRGCGFELDQGFLNKIIQRHGALITALVNQIGVHPRWRNFQYLDAGVTQAEPLRQ